jgi:tRNA(Ile)-lysidine synthase
MLGLLEAPRPSTLILPGGAEFGVRYGRFALRAPRAPAPAPAPFSLSVPGPGCWLGEGARVEVREVSGPGLPAEGAIRLDPARLRLPLALRTRSPGDRFRPRGGRAKKLKAWLIDRKLPREERGGLWLLADAAGEILWVVGLRDSQQAGLGERAERAWEVRVEARVEARGSSPGPRLLSSGGCSPGGAGRASETPAPEGLSDSVQGPK